MCPPLILMHIQISKVNYLSILSKGEFSVHPSQYCQTSDEHIVLILSGNKYRHLYVGSWISFPIHAKRSKCIRLDRVKRIWYLSPMRAPKVQASLRIRTVSPEPSLLAHTSSESRGTFTQKARSLAPLNGWACAVKICHDGMLEDTNSLDGAQINVCGCVSCCLSRKLQIF